MTGPLTPELVALIKQTAPEDVVMAIRYLLAVRDYSGLPNPPLKRLLTPAQRLAWRRLQRRLTRVAAERYAPRQEETHAEGTAR